MNNHPFINYGIAVVMANNNVEHQSEIIKQNLIDEIQNSINHFRVKPSSIIIDQTFVKFSYCDDAKGKPEQGVYLSSTILSEDKPAKNVYSVLTKLKEDLIKNKSGNVDITRAIAPIAGEFGKFGSVIGRGKPKTSIDIAAFCLITTTTHRKPALVFKTIVKEKGKLTTKRENIAIIPDLPVPKLVDFIHLFEQMRIQSTENLMIGSVNQKDQKPSRPKIFDGNFPNAPRSSALGTISLLGAIGAWAKEASIIDWANKVLDTLKDKPIYTIGSKTFETYTYNHFIVELAKENKLKSIIDSIYYVVLYNQGFRSGGNKLEYQRFDLFASRFLQLFNRPAFKDFLSFRAEYPNQLEILFKNYFMNMEKISAAVVQSARELGKWLNYAAYKVADNTVENDTQDRKEKVRIQKAKNLIEIESSVFSARSGDALIFQAITRAGRSSGLDAPSEAEQFMTQTATGELSLDNAKHLLIAFSRVRNKYEPQKATVQEEILVEENETDDSDDLSEAQE